MTSAKHSLLTATYVEVLPDPGALPGLDDRDVRWQLRKRAEPSTPDELRACAKRVINRAKQLEMLSKRHPFDLEIAKECARKLLAMCKDIDRLDEGERFLLRGALEYFLAVEDGSHDLATVDGFSDDLAVAEAVAAKLC